MAVPALTQSRRSVARITLLAIVAAAVAIAAY
ncbi:MAG: hypothetical protein QOC86_2477, partial [Gaiellales bacterium]|nr:hypothetical protein [Gaiellales bacterium]